MTSLIEILISLLSSIIGVSTSVLKPLFLKSKLLKEEKKTTQILSDKVDRLTTSLKESSELMIEIETEFANQKALAEKWAEEANTSQIIASMNQKEIDAVTKIFGGQLEKENKKSSRQSLIWNIVFGVIGLLGGYLISKFLL